MKKLYYFFDLEYESVTHLPNLPYRVLLVSIGYVGLHWHPEFEILLMLKGAVKVRNSRGVVSLRTGDMMIINSNELHGLVEESENLMVVLQPDPALFSMHLEGRSTNQYLLPDKDKPPESLLIELRRDMAGLAKLKWDGKPGNESFALSALYHLIGVIQSRVPSIPDTGEVRDNQVSLQKRTKRVLDYLHENYAGKIRLGDIAEYLNVSSSYLSHLIKNGTGRSFQENLNFIRIGHAVDLLMKTDMKLIDISMSVGFSDPKFFNQHFQRLFGATPRELKRRPDWRQAILNHYRNDGLDPSLAEPFIHTYL